MAAAGTRLVGVTGLSILLAGTLGACDAEREHAGPLRRDGENWDFVAISPTPATGRAHEQLFPAGTTFSRTWRCAGKYPGEITFARGLSVGDAQQQVNDALAATDVAGNAAAVVLFGVHGTRKLKYEVVEKLVGDTVADAVAVCGDRPIRMHAPVIGEWARDDTSVPRRPDSQEFFMGLRIDCEGGAPEGN